ncbi:MAG: PorT family protein [Chitinophagales bacterium]|nr:PorT family protein [Chitinophagales bacterium]
MKTKPLFIIVALFLAQSAMAQFHLGIKGGANIMKMDGESFKDKFEYGYHLGGFMEIGLGRKWSMQPEVLFNQFATTVDSNFNHIYENVFNPAYRKDVKLNYISIPILLNYKLIGNFVSLQAGPQFGVLMNQNKNLLQNGGEAFSHGDLTLLGGVQVKVAALRITGRYGIGLKNLNDIDNQDKWTSQGFQVSLGLSIL